MPKVSIVVPVYNAQNWLEKCIESLIAQTESDIEIILVDDKSTDDSLDICEKYERQDSRIRVIRKENGGPHSARKAGTMAATAEYVMYVDSDDWIESDMAEKLLYGMQKSKSQCLIFAFTEHIGEKINLAYNKIESGIYSGERLKEEVFKKMLCPEASFEQSIVPALWGKLFETETMRKVMQEVDEDIWIGEDLACTMKYVLGCKCIQIDNSEHGYHYIVRENTITTKQDPKYFDKAYRLGKLLEKTILNKNMEFLQTNINYYKLFLLYREIGVALKSEDKEILNQYLSEMEKAAKTPMYQELKEQISWQRLQVTRIEKRLLRSLLYGRYQEFRGVCYLLYWNRRRKG